MGTELSPRSFLEGADAIKILRQSIRTWVRANNESDEWVLDCESGGDECRQILCGIWAVFLGNLHLYFNEEHADLSSKDRSTKHSFDCFVTGRYLV